MDEKKKYVIPWKLVKQETPELYEDCIICLKDGNKREVSIGFIGLNRDNDKYEWQKFHIFENYKVTHFLPLSQIKLPT